MLVVEVEGDSTLVDLSVSVWKDPSIVNMNRRLTSKEIGKGRIRQVRKEGYKLDNDRNVKVTKRTTSGDDVRDQQRLVKRGL